MLHWKLNKKWEFNKAEKCTCTKQKVLEFEDCKTLWDFPIPTVRLSEHNGPDITVINKKSKKCLLIDPACSFDTRIEKKEGEKSTNYSKLQYEIAKIWKMRKVEVITVVIEALGTVTKDFEKWIQKLDLDLAIVALQKSCLLGAARII